MFCFNHKEKLSGKSRKAGLGRTPAEVSSDMRQRLLVVFESQRFSKFSWILVNGFIETLQFLYNVLSFLTLICVGFLSLAAKIALIPEKLQWPGHLVLSWSFFPLAPPSPRLLIDIWRMSEPEDGMRNSLEPDPSMSQGVSGLISK